MTTISAEHSSRRLSFHLRHDPGKAVDGKPLPMDRAAYMNLSDVLDMGIREGWISDDVGLLQLIENNDRFEFSADSWDEEDILDWSTAKVRACSGHSLDVDLGYNEYVPQHALYIGVGSGSSSSIEETGLKLRGKRKAVRLIEEQATAQSVAARRDNNGEGVVFEIDAVALHVAGHRFKLASNGEVLTDQEIAPEFIKATEPANLLKI